MPITPIELALIFLLLYAEFQSGQFALLIELDFDGWSIGVVPGIIMLSGCGCRIAKLCETTSVNGR